MLSNSGDIKNRTSKRRKMQYCWTSQVYEKDSLAIYHSALEVKA
jgi:hypothetical protein